MKMTFRWYGESDNIPLSYIKQVPNISSIVTALYNYKVGEIWPLKDILELKKYINDNGLKMEVIESVPVHEDIKLRRGNFKKYIDNYKKNIANLSKAGIKCICYNFMPVFDWTRSQLDYELKDGSRALIYHTKDVENMNPLSGELALPGWDCSYEKNELKELINAYQELGSEGLWANLKLFLEEIIPVAEKNDVLMAIHPDDPPWPIFGIPRIITSEKNIDRFLKLVDSHYNGLTFCVGSLGCNEKNNVYDMIDKYSKQDKIHFMHIRNVLILKKDEGFEEAAHMSSCGSIDMYKVLKILHENNFDKYIRPDHGRMIWGEKGKPGYGLYDRSLGAMYLEGIIEALKKSNIKIEEENSSL